MEQDDIFDLNWISSVRQYLDKLNDIGLALETDGVIPRYIRSHECEEFFRKERRETREQERRQGSFRSFWTWRVIS